MNYLNEALEDLVVSVSRLHLALMLGWQDIKQRYRRSKLGPFWLTISMGIMIGTIGIVFGQVFKTPMHEYLPFLATGIILWTFFSAGIMEGSSAFIEGAGMIRQLNLPLLLYPMRVLWRNLIVLFHNVAILPVLFLLLGKGVNWHIALLVPGFLIFLLNVTWMSLMLALLSTRYRDMPQIINSVLQVMFYITPVIWVPNSLNPRSASLLMEPNPLYHLLQIVRGPILGQIPTFSNWMVSITLAVVGLLTSLIIFGKYRKRIAYWL